MKTAIVAVALSWVLGASGPVFAEEPPAERVDLTDGSTLYLHPDGTGRMVDQHGKPMAMADGVEMKAADGRMIMMMNKKIWVRYGPPGREQTVQKND